MEKAMSLNSIRKYRNASLVSTIIASLLVLVSTVYSWYQVRALHRELEVLESEKSRIEQQKLQLEGEVRLRTRKVQSLKATESDILDTLNRLIAFESVDRHTISPEQWREVKGRIMELPPGRRKTALFTAFVVASGPIHFKMGGENQKEGFDAVSYITYVLDKVGIVFPRPSPGEHMSDTIINKLVRTEHPMVGDLMFFSAGGGMRMGLFYLGQGRSGGRGIGLGQLPGDSSIHVIDSIRAARFPFVGYFSIPYDVSAQ